MKYLDLTERLLDTFAKKERDPKRIHVSSVYAYLEGWKNYPIDLESAMRMWRGTWKHKMVQELLPEYEHEKKGEYPFGDNYVLVGHADCWKEDHGIEIKTSEDMKEAKPWDVMQAKLYCTMFEVPYFYIMQPAFTRKNFYLKKLRRVGRDDEYFNKTLDKLLCRLNTSENT